MAGERKRREEPDERTMKKRKKERERQRPWYAYTRGGYIGETGPRNDFTGITPAKSGRYGAAKCDVAIRHSRGLYVRACPGRPAGWLAGWLDACLPAGLPLVSSRTTCTGGGFSHEREKKRENHSADALLSIIDPPMRAFASRLTLPRP